MHTTSRRSPIDIRIDSLWRITCQPRHNSSNARCQYTCRASNSNALPVGVRFYNIQRKTWINECQTRIPTAWYTACITSVQNPILYYALFLERRGSTGRKPRGESRRHHNIFACAQSVHSLVRLINECTTLSCRLYTIAHGLCGLLVLLLAAELSISFVRRWQFIWRW